MIDSAEVGAILASGGTLITATHRLARHLRWRHDQSMAASGATAWPTADVLPLDAWLQRSWEASLFEATNVRRLLSDDESRIVWRRVLASEGQERLDAGVLVPLVANGWQICQQWNISPASLLRSADSEDSQAFARWVDAYQRELRRNNWIDSAALLGELATSVPIRLPGSELVIGFAGFEPWMPAVDGLATALRTGGARVVVATTVRRSGSRQVVRAVDDRDEVARAFDWAAGCLGRNPGTSVAIVVANLERKADVVRRIGMGILAPGWQLREPHVRPLHIALGRRLADYPIAHCASTLLQLIATDARFEEISQLLRSGYIGGAEAERAARAHVELKLRRQPLDRMRLQRLLPYVGRHAEGLGAQWRKAELLAAPVRNRQLTPSQWAGHFTAWLAAAGWPGGRGLASEEYQAAEAWQRLLESFAALDEVTGAVAIRYALGLLTQQSRDRPFEPEGIAGTVQILSVNEAAGQDFDGLWICGVTADQWPPAARPHALIPLALQRAAGIPEASADGVVAHTRRRFEQLLDSADEVLLSWPREQEGAETLPSPLLAGLAAASHAMSAIDRNPDRSAVALSAALEEVASDLPPLFEAGREVAGGSRVLGMQAVCPARAFIEFRLRGAALEAPSRPLDAATRGKIVHRLLERIYQRDECRAGLGPVAADALRQLFEALIVPVFDEYLSAGDELLEALRPLEARRLWKLVLSLKEIDTARARFRVDTEVERRITVGALSLVVRLDRLDRLDDGGEFIVDYKTGNFTQSGWKRPRLPDSQLPLYAVSGATDAANRGIAVIQVRVPEVKFIGVGDEALDIAGVQPVQKFFKPPETAWSSALARWRAQLESLAAEFAAGDFRVNPADRRWATGQFAGLTRVHELAGADDDLSNDEDPDE